MVEQKPAFGWGYNAYEQYDELYREPVLGLAVNDAATSHNTYLLIAAEMGLVGFSLYMFPLIWWFLESRKVWPRMGSSGFLSRPMLVMLWLLMLDHISVAGFVDMFQSNLFGRTMWWMALGLIASLVSLTLDRSSKAKMKPANR
jgi:O-antigen ligase